MQVSGRSNTFRWLAGSLLAIALAAPARSQVPAQEQTDPVEAYLLRLGLTEHAIEYLETELAKRPNREVLARDLAGLYAMALLENPGPEEAERLQKKVRDLLQKHPSARSPQLETILLQADFAKAEGVFAKWVFDPADTRSRDAAAEIFGRVGPQFRAHAFTLETAHQKTESEVEKMRDGPERDAKIKNSDLIGAQLGRAMFFSAWSQYYLAQLKSLDPGDELYKQSSTFFKKLVQTETPPQQPDPDELGLGSANRARSVLGLALVEIATGNLENGEAWLKILADPRVNEEVRGNLDFWHLFGLAQAGRTDQALAFAKSRADTLPESNTPGVRNFLKLLVVKGGHAKGPWSPLAELGIRGLARLGLPDVARSMAGKYQIPLGDASPEGRMLSALQLLDAAEKSKSSADYKSAAEALSALLSMGKLEDSTRARLAYQHAYCLAKANDWAAALKVLDNTLPTLRTEKSPLLPDASWLWISALEARVRADSSLQPKLVQALKDFARDFPNHPRAREASALMVANDGAPVDLGKLKPEDPAYQEKLFVLTRKAYAEWRSSRSEGTTPSAREVETLKQLREATAKYLALPVSEKQTPQWLEISFMAADSWISGNPPDLRQGTALLQKVEPIVKNLPLDARAASDFQVLKMRSAQANSDLAGLATAAGWFAKNRPNSPLHEAALVAWAKTADAQLAKKSDTGKSTGVAEAVTAYTALVSSYGPAPENVLSSRNSRIATFRLAELLFEQGKNAEVRDLLQNRLLKAFPKETRYLRLMGLASDNGQDTDRALECWRLLTNGLPTGTPAWYEAKLHHMTNLAIKSKADAQLAFAQFKVLHPDFGPEPYRAKFTELEAALAR